MNPVTLMFKDKELENQFNKEEEANLLEKLFQILIAGAITLILGVFFWYSKNCWYYSLVQILMLVYLIIVYYFMIKQKRYLKYLTLVIGTMSLFASGNQMVLTLFPFEISREEKVILQDGIMLAMFSIQISNIFLINTCQYLLFISFRFYISFNPQFWIPTTLSVLYSVIIIHNDYVRIKTLRNGFLLKEFNNNQLKMLENLKQPIIVVEFDPQSQRLIEHFVNKAFRFKNIDTISFIKNCLVGRNNTLYTVLLQMLRQFGPHQQLSIVHEKTKYLVNSETYKGDKILVALEFIHIVGKNVPAIPYFYASLLHYIREHNLPQYKIQIMKNLCGYLLYQPQKLKLELSQVSLNKIASQLNPQIIESETEIQEQFRSTDLLLYIFCYLLKKCFNVDRLEIKKENAQEEPWYRFYITGILKDGKLSKKQISAIIKILKIIIKLIGLDDLIIMTYNCSFTLINLAEKFLIL